MTRIGIVTVPYIRTTHHLILACKTMASLWSIDVGEYSLDKIAVANAFDPVTDDVDQFLKFFDCWIVSDRNVLARSWNHGIELAFERGNDYSLVINLDILFHPLFLRNIIEGARKYSEAMTWSGQVWQEEATIESAPLPSLSVEPGTYFSCFLVDRRLFEQIGKFDENLKPAYHEDCDMNYRIALADFKQYRIQNALFYHYDRATLIGLQHDGRVDDLVEIERLMDESMEYYARKWGGLPGHEVFRVPFNGESV